MKLNNLEDVFNHQLMDMYSVEKQLTDALQEMAKAASAKELKDAFEGHLKTTREQMNRLEQIGEKLGVKVDGHTCIGIKGIIDEGKQLIKEGGSDEALDAALITAAQRAEHYEIAGYGSACTYAKALGKDEALKLLKQTLDEEEKTDEALSKLAESGVNKAAMNA